jgi:hypothetical protein
MTVDVVTGEIVPTIRGRLSTEQAAERAQWVRDMHAAVLTEGVDYDKLPNTQSPTLLKPGAEMLLLAAGLGFSMTKLEDADAREHEGVTYKCTVTRSDGSVAAECDGFAGYEESRFYRAATATKSEYRAPWNTLVKMAQKRALVGAALNATAASGMFIADIDDERDKESAGKRKRTSSQRADPAGSATGTRSGSAPAAPPAELPEGAQALFTDLGNASADVQSAFRKWRTALRLDWPPRSADDVAEMAHELARIKAEEDRDTYEPPIGSPID